MKRETPDKTAILGRLERKLNPFQKKVLAEVPPSSKISYAKSLLGQLSASSSIKVKCLECCGWERSEARDCGIEHCPLYGYRFLRARRGSTAPKSDPKEQE